MSTITNGESGLSVRTKINAAIEKVDGTASSWEISADSLDLKAIAETKAVTAVDVFVYDTSKDSDGGAWRNRTQGTSWYNETLNTSTRGSRREFPAVAVIVAESNKVTIYDGDDPTLPMWMVFNGGSSNLLRTITITSISALQGFLVVGATTGLSSVVMNEISFLADRSVDRSAGTAYLYNGTISERNSGLSTTATSATGAIVNANVNDVAMTVLPDAPTDPATGLPVPTIAVATQGGVSVIKDDGTVVDNTTGTYIATVMWDEQNNLHWTRNLASPNYYITSVDNLTADGFSIDYTFSSVSAPTIGDSVTNAGFNLADLSGSTSAFAKRGSYIKADGMGLLQLGQSVSTSMIALLTSTYNTGWMPGDIKGAFLSDTDDTDLVGSGELVTNGTFDTDVSGWTAVDATLSVSSNALLITNTAAAGWAHQTITTVVGQTYILTFDLVTESGQAEFYVRNVSYAGGTVISSTSLTAGTAYSVTFVAQNVSTVIALRVSGGIGNTASFDNISVKLADADRSVANRGLIVNGTVTRTAVSSGADLVAYSGFSASNYLEQPYNPDLDFGTGDFSIIGWVKGVAVNIRQCPIVYKAAGFECRIDFTTGYPSFWDGTSRLIGTISLTNSPWRQVTFIRKSGVGYIYIDGVLNVSGALAADVNATASMLVGGNGSTYYIDGGSLALLRISATAPTADQILKIYNDEKVLFQDNAGAVLAGTSDAVTSLAYDDATQELLVGTNQNTSVFRGLRRVETISGSATAISASNGLRVIED